MRTISRFGLSRRTAVFAVAAVAAVMTFAATGSAKAMMDKKPVKISVSAIGRPPIFSNTFADVGQAMGFFKAAGADVNFRWFQRGSDTGKAVITGDVAIGFTSSQAGLNLIASGAPIVAVAGMPQQDWIVATDDPGVKKCADLKGKTVAADGINNARYLYLASLVETCGLKLSDLKLLNLANAPLVKAGIAGQVHDGVFHIDELSQVEFKTGKKWTIIPSPPAIKSELHYAMLVASKKAIKENREGVIRFLEGWILTQNMMGSHAPADKVAFANVAAHASQIDFKVALSAIDAYQKIGYWVNDNGLPEKQVMGQLAQLVKIGSIKADKKPTYDQIADTSLYAEAMKRVRSMFGQPGS